MRIKEKRMKSFVSRANVLTQAKKQAEAAKVVNDGLQYYSNNAIKAISPYAAADAGMIVVVLRHLQHRNNKDDPERNWKYDIQNCQKMQCECELS